MAKGTTRKGLEEQIEEINALRADPDRPEARALLAKAFESPRALLVQAAANAVGEAELDGFAPALQGAFERFMQQAVKTDPGCRAKTSIARALYRLGERAYSVFLSGIRHVQPEPVWGGSQDTAVELRGQCALGLVRGGYPDALLELADLLGDREPMARLGAAQAIGYSERADVGLPLLRLKARLGDEDNRVTAACFAGLLGLAPDRSLEFVAGFALAPHTVETREAALLALGESRLPAALPALRRVTEDDPLASELRAVAFMAVALMRSDAGWDYLLGVVRESSADRAREALDALATFRSEPVLRERALAAARERDESALRAHAERVLRAPDGS